MAEQQAYDETEQMESGSGRRLPGLLQVAWQHKSLMVIGVVTALVAGGLVYAQSPPLYQSSTQVDVQQKRPEFTLPGTEGRGAFTFDYLGNHIEIIRSPLVVSAAVNKAGLKELPSFEGLGDPTRAIIDQLKVTRHKEATSMLMLTFRGPVAEDCPVVLRAILNSYKDYLDSKYRNVSQDTVNYMKTFRNLLGGRLTELETAYAKFRTENPEVLRGEKGTNVLQERLLNLEKKKSELQLRQLEVLGRIASIEKAQENRSQKELLLLIRDSERKVLGDTAKVSPKDDPIFDLELREHKLLEVFGPDHPEVKSLRKQKEMILDWTKLNGKDDVATANPVKAHLRFLESELDDARTSEKDIDKLLDKEKDAVKRLVDLEGKEKSLNADIARNEAIFEITKKRLDEIDFVKDLGGFEATTIAEPGNGGKVAPRGMVIMGVAGMLGLLCGLGLAYAAEITDHSFRTPEEIRQQLGLPVVGHIPFFKGEPAVQQESDSGLPVVAPMLNSYYYPKSHVAESYRGVRTSLLFSACKHGYKIIQVTSPDMGDGKSTLAANLAVSIAQSGKRVILLDADFRRPQVHKLFGVSSERGLASVVAGEAELADVTQATGVPNLWVLPCGPHPPNPAELLNRPRLKELLDYLKEQYDFVIVDTPPLLAVTDPCVVIPHVDAVILTIRVGKNVRPHAQRAKEILLTLGANVLGVVVNEANRNASTSFGYSGYKSGYGYTYGYEYGKNAYSYYSEPEPANGDAVNASEDEGEGEGEGEGEANGKLEGANPSGRRGKAAQKGLLKRLWERL